MWALKSSTLTITASMRAIATYAWIVAGTMWDVVGAMWTVVAFKQAAQPLCGLLNNPKSPHSTTVQNVQVEAKKRKIDKKRKKREKQFA